MGRARIPASDGKMEKNINEDKNKMTVGNLLTRDHQPGDHRK